MLQPVKSGRALIEEIDRTISPTPTLWWLGHSGFILRFANITFYIDPNLSVAGAPLEASSIRHADLILTTHVGNLDAPSIHAMLENSRTAKLVLPKSAATLAYEAGIPYQRMTTTDADLRIEYFKDNLYGRVYAVPAAHPRLDWTADGGYPYLGYLIRFGRWTVYHAGNCAMYDGLIERLRRFNVSVAMLPIGGGNFSVSDAADLARGIGAAWMVPIDADGGQESALLDHMLGHRPEQPFKVFQCAEKWTVPED